VLKNSAVPPRFRRTTVEGYQGAAQEQLFYSFSLQAHVPADHLLRGIDRFLDLSTLREHLAPFYSHTGRLSIDPELMMRMLVIGYCFGIRSERRLCEEVHLNLAYRWFWRLDLLDRVPTRALPPERCIPPPLRNRASPLHEGGAGWRRRVRRCQRDQGRCEPLARCTCWRVERGRGAQPRSA
jgi:hypothetical protein